MDKTRFQQMVEQDQADTPMSLSLERLSKVFRVNINASKPDLRDAMGVVQFMEQEISRHIMFAGRDRNPRRGYQRVLSLYEMGAVNNGLKELLMTHPNWPKEDGFDDDCE